MARKSRRVTFGQDPRVRQIELRLRQRLRLMFPDIDVAPIMQQVAPIILEAARDGLTDHSAIWRRAGAAPAFHALLRGLAKAIGEQGSGQA